MKTNNLKLEDVLFWGLLGLFYVVAIAVLVGSLTMKGGA